MPRRRAKAAADLIGVVFMALTLTITSFTCTFPVVGGLLVMAAGGDFFYPIVGLATFATVLALPFFLLALSPGLISKMPRSGDWMNAVKVVGGLIEIGAALKFINTAELAYVMPEEAWFDAQVVLTCWIALSLVCGLYLLGVFRTDHDHDDVKVGTGRLRHGRRVSWDWPSTWRQPFRSPAPEPGLGSADCRNPAAGFGRVLTHPAQLAGGGNAGSSQAGGEVKATSNVAGSG